MESQLWLCEYCDHAPFRREYAFVRHSATHTEDAVALFGRDMTYRNLVRKASRIARVIQAVGNWTWSDTYAACYDATIDLLLAASPITNRNIRRDAYRKLMNEHETSLDEMMLDGGAADDADDADVFAASHAYAQPDAAYSLSESLLEIADGKYGIESPLLWLGVTEDATPKAVVLTGYDAMLANVESALEESQLALRKATERRGRPRKIVA